MREDFARTAALYDAAAVLARETGRRMAERLDLVKIAPRCIADIGCATGDGIRELQRRYPQALPLAVDPALPMLAAVRQRPGLIERLRGRAPRTINADVRALPLAGGSLGLAWSNLMLHWLDDPRPALAELHRTLEVGGLLMFSMLGPDTLKELRGAAREVMRSGIHGNGAGDAPQEAPLGATVRSFLDLHDIGDMLVAAGFADPVMDMEMVTLTYTSPRGLLRDQRHLGVRDVLFGRMGWRDWRKVLGAWERVDQRLPASFEIVYGHAWKAAPRASPDGRAIVRLHRR